MTEQTSTSGASSNIEDVDGFELLLKEQANKLKEAVDGGDISSALAVISDINQTRDKTLYVEVGRLTRSLYESIRNFQIDCGDAQSQEELSKINDASDRLAYVVDMTSNAANKTMDLVEDTMPYASHMNTEAKQLKSEWEKLRRKEMTPSEFRDLSGRMDGFLEQLTNDSDKVYQNLSAILLAQDFQDLTGQVINRVTGLVKEVEENLVNLVSMAGKVDTITGTVHDIESVGTNMDGEGPQMNKEERADVVSGQDDVDDLLSSLGF
ncbi:protein phosphatase CheZ [Oleiphilus sp. HI0079]|jgi:chemotaxis protein CheZ|uniref:protein phosphatase CheZ n=1 Tax=Oleiphilus sp. HI0079 TaxID=1822254 RepID=UPI0009ED93CD|nr:protein phosphatase CheZ [Oleiphilus sp. HI0079]